jgi:(p)ppGpp synthase/HD superfamily hydrolase
VQRDDQERLAQALRFALEAHGEQKRKGTEIPYVSHLLQVAGLVLEHAGSVDQTVAALLHDTIEDCDVAEATLRERFGAEVARIVRACSDVLEGDSAEKKSPWKERKTRYIEHMRGEDAAARLVSGCDKLHNLRSMLADLHADGTGTLERFSGTPRQLLWYYREVRAAVGEDMPRRLLRELDAGIGEFAEFVEKASVE